MRLLYPDMLLFLFCIPIFIGLYIINSRYQKKKNENFINHKLLEKLTPSLSKNKVLAKRFLFIIAIILLIIAAARPQYGNRVRFIEKNGIDIVFVIDTSKSMLADDIKPSRFQNAVRTIKKILEKRSEDRVGIVSFSGDAFIQSPLTSDYDGFKVLLDAVSVGSLPLPGTNFEIAIDKALLALSRAGGDKKGAIVILSDGENHTGDIDGAVARVKESGSKIFTFGFGSENGSPISERGSYKKDRDGNIVISKLDREVLIKIAEETGGKYYTATPIGTEIDDFLNELSKFAKTELLTKKVESYAEQYQILLGIALILLSAESLINNRRKNTNE